MVFPIFCPLNDKNSSIVVSVHFPVDTNEVNIAGFNDQRGIILILGIVFILLVVVVCTCIAFLVHAVCVLVGGDWFGFGESKFIDFFL